MRCLVQQGVAAAIALSASIHIVCVCQAGHIEAVLLCVHRHSTVVTQLLAMCVCSWCIVGLLASNTSYISE